MISACICTHNPNPAVLARCLEALRVQEPGPEQRELLIIDNRSDPALSGDPLGLARLPFPARVVREENLGLTQARVRAWKESRGEILVFIDDDNFLAPDYLNQVHRFFAAHPEAGAVGGQNQALPEVPVPAWCDDGMLSFLACYSRGDRPIKFDCELTPYGAGMALRKEAFGAAIATPLIMGDRVGNRLSSGGDTELCYRIRLAGWELWFEPALRLEHYLPARRLTVDYFERLNHGFGLDRPYIEFYWHPGSWRRRLSYVRRAATAAWSAWREGAHLDLAREDREMVQARLRVAFRRGEWRSLLRLAVGPPLWNAVPKRRSREDHATASTPSSAH